MRTRLRAIGVVGMLSLGVSLSTHAALLNLPTIFPDTTVQSLKASYVYSAGPQTGVFTATAAVTKFHVETPVPTDYTLSAGPNQITGGKQFNLSMTVNSAGVPISGSVSVTGKITGLGANSDTLLTGTIDQFGFQDSPGGTLFDFKFTLTGGDFFSPTYYSSKGGITMIATAGIGGGPATVPFTGVFNQGFTTGGNVGTGNADIFVAPEPASFACLMISGAGLIARRAGRRGSK